MENENLSDQEIRSIFPGRSKGMLGYVDDVLNNAPVAGAVGVALMATGIGEAALVGFGAYMVFKGAAKFVRHSIREKIENDYNKQVDESDRL